MCVRGYFEEGYSGDHLLGSYFSQLYEMLDVKYPQVFKGFVTEVAAMITAVDWLYTRITSTGRPSTSRPPHSRTSGEASICARRP